MTDIAKITEALKKDAIIVLTAIELAQRLDGMGQARFAARWSDGKLALERIVRLAARVGEGWCFDMEAAKDHALPVDLWIIYLDLKVREIECTWDVSGQFWRDRTGRRIMLPALCWRPLPPPPETNDE